MAQNKQSGTAVCPTCGEDAEGPGAKAAITRHIAKMHGGNKSSARKSEEGS